MPDSEEEGIIFNVVLERSRKTACLEAQQRTGAGPSTSRGRNTAGEAETYSLADDMELLEDFAETDDLSELSVLESADDEPVSTRKGKAKAKSKKGMAKSKGMAPVSPVPLSWAERQQVRRSARRERCAVKREERLLAQKLGRPLTWVCQDLLVGQELV